MKEKETVIWLRRLWSMNELTHDMIRAGTIFQAANFQQQILIGINGHLFSRCNIVPNTKENGDHN